MRAAWPRGADAFLQVDAGAELRDRWLRGRLNAERQPSDGGAVDRHHERVIALGLEHDPVEVQGEGRRPLTRRRTERGLEGAARAEGAGGPLRIEERERQRVLTG